MKKTEIPTFEQTEPAKTKHFVEESSNHLTAKTSGSIKRNSPEVLVGFKSVLHCKQKMVQF